MLRTLPEDQKGDWKKHLNKVIHAYNCSQHETTGFSPFYLMFGRSARLPIDLAFKLQSKTTEGAQNPTEYSSKWKARMEEAYNLVSKNIQKGVTKSQQTYNRKVHHRSIQPGDRVLVKNCVRQPGPAKLQSYFEDKVYLSQPNHMRTCRCTRYNPRRVGEESEFFTGTC
ncbi:Retrovirus-related Pol polyprotein from transposon [Apostichopus japonicus]|uniref:Retrovirus-related Pol polyprotein from transposon n=1 Tax=Stichopus japonicus TaxID=307972 RepID=A0A2G8L1P7_STIJA|nr:Retrovirus-related Pol polyprotein from transposon [Apostichopus japonicus]